jgi:hypothetical protein
MITLLSFVLSVNVSSIGFLYLIAKATSLCATLFSLLNLGCCTFITGFAFGGAVIVGGSGSLDFTCSARRRPKRPLHERGETAIH